MATDYIIFIHGLNTRDEGVQPNYADEMIKMLKKHLDPSRTVKFVPLYWGDIAEKADARLLQQIKKSPVWDRVWFRKFREGPMLRFVGDAALYISRHMGADVIEVISKQAIQELKKCNVKEDRLHLVTHSWGTIILFDALFSDRWDEEDAPGHTFIEAVRNAIFGMGAQRHEGIRLASVYTMGSPIVLFYLMNVDGSTHDITPHLEELLSRLKEERGGKKLRWCNFVNPGDPIAFPIATLMPDLVDRSGEFIEVEDIITRNTSFLFRAIAQNPLALVQGGTAHDSYWHSQAVAKKIAEVIISSTSA